MPKIVPSQVVTAIDSMFGLNQNDVFDRQIGINHLHDVRSLLSLLDWVPDDLFTPTFSNLTEFLQCRAALTFAISRWDVGDNACKVKVASGKDAIARIRAILKTCPDENPPAVPELRFVFEIQARRNLEGHIRAAWVDFKAEEWTGATVFGAAASEAMLYWGLRNHNEGKIIPKLDRLHLSDYVRHAKSLSIISSGAADQATLANDVRNLIHAGKVDRSGLTCDKSTALTSLAAMERIIKELVIYFESVGSTGDQQT
jgi:hypothetical protein